jgi:hypothetical protein
MLKVSKYYSYFKNLIIVTKIGKVICQPTNINNQINSKGNITSKM